MLDLYPVTSGRLSIKENKNLILGYDGKTKIQIELNKNLEDLLVLCNGEHSIKDIVQHISNLYKISDDKLEQKIIQVLNSLKGDNLIEFRTERYSVPIRLRRYDFEWPLQSVFIELTNRCNLKCIHCYNNSSSNKNYGLDKKNLFSFLDQIDELGVFHVYFTGGEPFVRKDFNSVIRYAYSKGFDIGILTNGSLINNKSLNLLEKINPEFIAISLDSLWESKYKKIRGISNKKVIENIFKLRNRGINVRINVVLFEGLNNSYEDVISLLKFLKTNGFNEKDIAIDEFLGVGRGLNFSEYSLNQKKTIKNIKKAFQEIYGHDYLTKPNYINKEPKRGSFCGLGESIFYLNSRGDVTLCTVLNDKRFKAGNIFKQPVREIWETSDLFKYFREKKHFSSSECETCFYLLNCAGGCKAKSIIFSGAFNKPDYWICNFLMESD